MVPRDQAPRVLLLLPDLLMSSVMFPAFSLLARRILLTGNRHLQHPQV